MSNKPNYDVLHRFAERVACPYNCGETFPSKLSLARHVLRDHNWNVNTLEPYDPATYKMAITVCKEVREILESTDQVCDNKKAGEEHV